MTVSLGLDLSATASGVVVLESKGPHNYEPKVLAAFEIVPAGVLKRFDRARFIAAEVIKTLVHKPDVVTIEGYAFASKFSQVTLVEVGTIVRYFLWQYKYQFLEPAPSQVKKFALGEGKGDKSAVMLQVYKRWAYEAKTNNIADAFVCAAIGLGYKGVLGVMIAPQVSVVGKLKLN